MFKGITSITLTENVAQLMEAEWWLASESGERIVVQTLPLLDDEGKPTGNMATVNMTWHVPPGSDDLPKEQEETVAGLFQEIGMLSHKIHRLRTSAWPQGWVHGQRIMKRLQGYEADLLALHQRMDTLERAVKDHKPQ